MPRNKYPLVRIHSHLAEQLTPDPATLGEAVNAFLAERLAPPEQPKTRRFNNQPYQLLATGLDIRPGPSGCKKRWGDQFSKFRVVIGRDGAWAVYGLARESMPSKTSEDL